MDIIQNIVEVNTEETISEYILRLRNEKGVTQYKAAKKININRAALKRLEEGKHIPCRRTLEAMSEYYKAPLDVLLAKTKVCRAKKREKKKAVLNEN